MTQEKDQHIPQDTATTEPKEESNPFEKEIASLTEEVTRLKDQLLRSLAEIENTRKRAQKDCEEIAKYAYTNFAKDMIGVSDNLKRALDSIPKEAAQADALMKGVLEGILMTQKQLASALEKHGIQEIQALGAKFDHNLHQAMFEVEDVTKPAGTVANVMEAGYTINGRLLRPAMVGVTKTS